MANIYTKLTFDGAKEYKEACHQINNSLKVLGAELKLVAAEYGRNDTSLEGLTRKQDVLKQKFEEQSKKVQENENALKALREEGTATDATFATFESRLLNSKAALTLTGKEIERVGVEIEKAGKEFNGAGKISTEYKEKCEQINTTLKMLGSELKLVSAEYGANDKSVEGLTKKQDVLKRTFAEQSKQVQESEKALKALKETGTASAAEIAAFEKTVLDSKTALTLTGKELENVEKDLRGTGRQVESTGKEFKTADKSSESFKKGLSNLNKVMGDVGNAAKKMAGMVADGAKAFASLTTGLLKVSSAAAGAVTAFGGKYIKDAIQSTQDMELAQTNLAQVMQNTLDATDAEIQSIIKLTAEQEKLGVVSQVSQITASAELASFVERREAMEDMLPTMNDYIAYQFGVNASEEQARNVATALGKAIQGNIDGLAKQGFTLTDNEKKWFKTANEQERVAFVIDMVSESMDGVNESLAQTDAGKMFQIGVALDGVKSKIGETAIAFKNNILGQMMPSVVELANAFSNLIDGSGSVSEMSKAFSDVFGKISEIAREAMPQIIELGASITLTIAQGIIESAPILIEGVSEIIPTVIDGIGQMLPRLIESAVSILDMLLNAIVDNVDILLDAGIDVVTAFASGIPQATGIILKAGAEIVQKLAEGISKEFPQVENAFTAISEAFENIIGAIAESDIIQNVITLFKKIGEVVIEIIPIITEVFGDTVANVIPTISKVVSALTEVLDAIKPLTIAIKALWSLNMIFRNIVMTVWGEILTKAFEVFGGIKKFIEDMPNAFNTFKESISSAKDSVVEWATNSAAYISDIAESIKKFFVEDIPNSFNSFKESISSIKDSVIEWATATVGCFFDFAESVLTFFEELPQKISDRFNEIITAVTEWITEMFDTVTTQIPIMIDNIVSFFASLPERISYALGFVIGTVLGTLAGLALKMTEWAKTEIPKFLNAVETFFSELPGRIEIFLSETLQNIITWGSDTVESGKETATEFLNNVVTFFSELAGKVSTYLSETFEKIVTWGADTVESGKETAMEFLDAVVTFFSELPGRIAAFLSETILRVVRWGSDTVESGKKTAKEFLDGVVKFFSELPGKIAEFLNTVIQNVITWGTNLVNTGKEEMRKFSTAVIDAVKELPDKFKAVGSDIVAGVWKGFQNAKDGFMRNVQGFFDGIVDGAKNVLKINSPSKRFQDEVGAQIAAGTAAGISANSDKAKKAAKKMSDDAYKDAKLWINNYRNDSNYLVSEEQKMWEYLGTLYKGVSKEKVEVDKNALKLKEQSEKDKLKLEKDGFEQSKKWIELKKKTNQLSLAEEIEAWERVQQRYLSGTEERRQADISLFEAKKRLADEQEKINKKMIEAEEKYESAVTSRTDAIFKSFGLFDELKEKEDKNATALKKAQDEYNKAKESLEKLDVQRRDSNLTTEKSIELNKEYAEKQAELSESTANLKNAQEQASKSQGQILTENLQAQVEEMRAWAENLNVLSAKGIDEGLLSELRKMGPSASAEIKALADMSAPELDNYSNLWQEKYRIAREQATEELAPLREETNTTIEGLLSDLDELVTTESMPIGENLVLGILEGEQSEAENLIAGSEEIISDAIDGAAAIAETESPQIGSEIISGATEGVESSKYILDEKVTSTLNDVLSGSDKIANAQGMTIGESVIQGICDGLEQNAEMLAEACTTVLRNLAQGISEKTSELAVVVQEIADTVTTGLNESLRGVFESGVLIIQELVGGIRETLPELQLITDEITITFVTNIENTMPNITTVGNNMMSALASGIYEMLPEVEDIILGIAELLPLVFESKLSLFFEAGKNAVVELVNGLLEDLQTLTDITIALGGLMAEGILTGVKNNKLMVERGFKFFFDDVIGSIKSTLGMQSGTSRIFAGIGENIVKGMWAGVQSQADSFKQNMKSFFDGIVKESKETLGIHSPSRVFAGIGTNMALGVGVGFKEEMRAVERDIQNAIPKEFDTNPNVSGLSAQKDANGHSNGRQSNGDTFIFNVNLDKLEEITKSTAIFDNFVLSMRAEMG